DAETVNVLPLVNAAGGEQLAVGRIGDRDAVDVGRQALQFGTCRDVEEDELVAGGGGQGLAVGREGQGGGVIVCARADVWQDDKLVQQRAGGGVPELDGVVQRAARGEDLAVGGKDDPTDHGLMGIDLAELVSSRDVPEADSIVPAAGGEQFAVGGKRHGIHAAVAGGSDQEGDGALG